MYPDNDIVRRAGTKTRLPQATMSESNQTFDARLGYQMYVPVSAIEAAGLGYNDEVRVTLYGPEDTITIKRPLNAASQLSIPAEVQRLIGLTPGENENVTVTMEDAGTKWEGETPMDTRSRWRKDVHHG